MEQHQAFKPENPKPSWYFSWTALDKEVGTNSGKSYDLYYTGGHTEQSYQSLTALKPMDSGGLSLGICNWFTVQFTEQLYTAFLFFHLKNMYYLLILFYKDNQWLYCSKHLKYCKCLATVAHCQKRPQKHNSCMVRFCFHSQLLNESNWVVRLKEKTNEMKTTCQIYSWISWGLSI